MAVEVSYQCRLCLDESPTSDPYIIPCQCRGSALYVHRQCLDTWRSQQPDGDNFIRCRECRFHYVIEVVPQNKQEEADRKKRYRVAVAHDIVKIILLILTLLIVIALFLYILDASNSDGFMFQLMPKSLGIFRYLLGSILFIFMIVGAVCMGVVYLVSGVSLYGTEVYLYATSFIGGVLCLYESNKYLQELVRHRKRTIWLRQEAEIRIVKDFKGREHELPPIEGHPHPPGGQQPDFPEIIDLFENDHRNEGIEV
jgi:hypothetical protein